MKPIAKILAIGLVASMFSTAALARPAAENEISTAIEHAEFSVNANNVATLHLHLHHVVNCLVGENGKQFYAKAGDPCKGMGNGAINDAHNAALKTRLEKILHTAERGLEEKQLTRAHKTASLVKRMLKRTMGQMSNKKR